MWPPHMGPAPISRTGDPRTPVLFCATVATDGEVAAHAPLSPLPSVGFPNTTEQVCSVIFGNPTEINGEGPASQIFLQNDRKYSILLKKQS